jgi:hypothetical protein
MSPMSLSGTVFYCWILALFTVAFIAWPSSRPSQG